jgi:hypothetical protein
MDFLEAGLVMPPKEDYITTQKSEGTTTPPREGVLPLSQLATGSSIYETYFSMRYLLPYRDPQYKDFLNFKSVTSGTIPGL